MRIIDISMPIRGDMPTYKERPEKAPLHTWAARLPHDSVNESVYTINVHTGTHLDAPLHMTDGDASVDTALPLERLITKARVFDLKHIEEAIEEKDLRDLGIEAGEFVLLKTANSYDPRSGGASFVYLKECGARYLAEKMISGRCFAVACSTARVIFSPTVVLMLPIKNRLSSTAATTGVPSMRPVAVMTASFKPVLPVCASSFSG